MLQDILYKVPLKKVIGSTEIEVNALHLDSRAVQENDVFIAMPGTKVDGHDYIAKAISNGAAVVVCEKIPQDLDEKVQYIQVSNAAVSLAQMSVNYYDNPASKLKLVAITGTNGKTSVATLLWKLYQKLGYQVGLLSTVENKIGSTVIAATHTTPNAIALNELLAQMVDAGCDYCFMEASSHAIHQKRTFALEFDGAVFTNLSHDHLDYHNTFKEYIAAKKELFDGLSAKAFALTNEDDKNGMVMLQNCKAKKYTYGLQNLSDYSAKILHSDFTGMTLSIGETEIHTALIGQFNAYNFLAVYGVATLLGAEKMEVLTAMSILKGAEGRFDYLISPIDKIIAIVDYAHTPDALKKVLETILAVKGDNEDLYTVVGCGGDRDVSKRPLMAAIAAKLSSKALLTSDNPRTENPTEILAQMRAGVAIIDRKKTMVLEQREEAIRAAISMAKPKDILLVAGKGHEKYQEINGVKHPFDDKEKILNAFKEMER